MTLLQEPGGRLERAQNGNTIAWLRPRDRDPRFGCRAEAVFRPASDRLTLLSDAGHEIIPAFGLLNESYSQSSPWYGLSHPLILVVDADGIVRHRFSERSYRNRPDVELVLYILRAEAGD